MRILLAVLAVTTAACGAAPSAPAAEGFAAGTWERKVWLEAPNGSTEPATFTGEVTKEEAAQQPAAIFFSEFYPTAKTADVRFEDGQISGSYDQSGVDDIAAQAVPISGTYSRDEFRVTLDFSVHGTVVREVIEGRLVDPAA